VDRRGALSGGHGGAARGARAQESRDPGRGGRRMIRAAALVVVACLVTIPGVPGAGAQRAPAPAQRAATDPHAALRSGAYEEAVQGFTGALARDPGAAEARIGLMQALAATGRYAEAVEA